MRVFRFTPSATPQRRAVTVGARARAIAPATSDQPGYDVGVALGLRGMALTGEAARIDTGLARRDAIALGIGYGRRDWQTRLRVGAEGAAVRGGNPANPGRRYSVELGGAYLVRQGVSVGAGVRYRVVPEDEAARLAQAEVDRAAYVGMGVAF